MPCQTGSLRLLPLLALLSLSCGAPSGETLRLRRELLHQQELNRKLRLQLEESEKNLLEVREGQQALFERLERFIQENRRLRMRLEERQPPPEQLTPGTVHEDGSEEPPAETVPEAL